jgi:hypothetical protein
MNHRGELLLLKQVGGVQGSPRRCGPETPL